jgi:predicted P-loop ATPase
MDKKWKNVILEWEELIEKCSETKRTAETVSEYRKMSKAKQDAIKDVGGFVGGALKLGRRKKGYVMGRSLITLDIDHAAVDIWDIITVFLDYSCMMYSTHKHTPQKPRVRLIIPLSREISEEEYPAVSRMIAKDVGIEMIDDTCHQASRLMYWPSTSSDGEYLFKVQEGPFLNPDDILCRYENWRDTSKWPVSSRESEIVKRTIEKQADPLEKDGVVGAFCRTYDMESAIETFLSNIYQPSDMDGRYNYVPADSSAGLVTYDNKFAYSHHATDPAGGQLLNAFDIVRLHKFSHLDDKTKDSTVTTNLPSYKSMIEFAINDEKVKMTLASDRKLKVSEEFASEEEWQKKLDLDKNGDIKDTLSNIVWILQNDEYLKGISYNEHRNSIDIREPENLPWTQVKNGWSDADLASAKVYFDRVYKIWSPTKFKDALTAVAAQRSFHPIKEYFDSLPKWDKKERLDTLLVDYLGAEDTAYTRAVMRKTLVAAVARIYNPGIKFDYILTIAGPQGIGKSTFFAKLGMQWFSDSLSISDMRDKTGPEKLQGYWILELSELNGIKKMDVETVKSFISRCDDKYRASYGTVVESHPRQCVIVGSTNSTGGFLRDITGNRRFWPVDVTGCGKYKPWDMECIDQIWAEAIYRYNEGEELVLTGDAAGEAYEKQQDAMENDDREGLVREYLDKLLPSNWKDMDLSERRMFLSGDEFSGSDGSIKRDRVCTLELWSECFGKDPASMKKTDAYELNAIMSKIEEWEKYKGNKSGRVRFPIYGPQYAYERVVSN